MDARISTWDEVRRNPLVATIREDHLSLFSRFKFWICRTARPVEIILYHELTGDNCYGFVVDLSGRAYICGCGGSGYLCRKHAMELLLKSAQVGDSGR